MYLGCDKRRTRRWFHTLISSGMSLWFKVLSRLKYCMSYRFRRCFANGLVYHFDFNLQMMSLIHGAMEIVLFYPKASSTLYPDKFENASFFLLLGLPSTLKWRFRSPKTELFQNGLQGGWRGGEI